MTELKPCPFCGGEAKYFDEHLYEIAMVIVMGIKCTSCGGKYTTNDLHKCPNDVIAAWNRRTPT